MRFLFSDARVGDDGVVAGEISVALTFDDCVLLSTTLFEAIDMNTGGEESFQARFGVTRDQAIAVRSKLIKALS